MPTKLFRAIVKTNVRDREKSALAYKKVRRILATSLLCIPYHQLLRTKACGIELVTASGQEWATLPKYSLCTYTHAYLEANKQKNTGIDIHSHTPLWVVAIDYMGSRIDGIPGRKQYEKEKPLTSAFGSLIGWRKDKLKGPMSNDVIVITIVIILCCNRNQFHWKWV